LHYSYCYKGKDEIDHFSILKLGTQWGSVTISETLPGVEEVATTALKRFQPVREKM
jgi:hypothetical protein